MTRLTRMEVRMVADRLHLHDCLHEVISDNAPELGADLDDVVNACDTTIAELEELELEAMVPQLTAVQRWCLIDAVEGATILVRSRHEPDEASVRRACNAAARKLSAALGLKLAFPRY